MDTRDCLFRHLQLDYIECFVRFPKMLYIGVIHPTPTPQLKKELPPGYPLSLAQLRGVLGLLPGRPITVEVSWAVLELSVQMDNSWPEAAARTVPVNCCALSAD